MVDKEALEKGRLMKRTGPAARMHRENLPDWHMGLTAMRPGAAGWMSDADRFHTDTSGEEYLRRKREVLRKQEMYDRKRAAAAEREEARRRRMEEGQRAEERRVAALRAAGWKSKSNRSNLPYDMLTLQYNEGLDGERQRRQDDRVRFRARLRTQNLQRCGGSRCGYDIITGGQRHASPAPARAPLPALPARSAGAAAHG